MKKRHMQAGRKKGLITCTEFVVFWLEKLTLRLTADIIIDRSFIFISGLQGRVLK
jgi:hypothetical protein